MEFSTRHRTRDNQRCTSIVNEYGIHLIDNGVVMRTLYKFIRRMCHIVTEVVKTKFVIGTIGDISSISHAATRRVRLIVIYTFHLETMELEKRCHPSTVSASQVVVHGNQMNSITSESVKVKRQGSHQSFTFPCLHLSNFSLVQSNPSYELYIIMYHIPSDRLSCCIPRIFPKGFVSLEEIQRSSDIITLHVPLTMTGAYPTAGMVDEAFLEACVRQPLLINACRGPVSPSAPLLRALERGQIADLILDCWQGEPEIHPDLPKHTFIATPHVAGWTADGKWRGSQMALEAVCRELQLPLPEGLWDESVLYTPDHPLIDLSAFSDGERLLRAQLHTCSLTETTRGLQAEPSAFDSLRRAYRFPREASAFTVRGARAEERKLLEQLGFVSFR